MSEPSPHAQHEASESLREAAQRRPRWGQALLAVAWSFFGVRRQRDWEQDSAQLNPIHVVIAGLLLGALFVGGLLIVVNWVVSSGAAAA